MEPLKLALLAAKALDNKKALDIKLLHVEDLTILADYFVIASGTSSTHVASLAEEVDFQLSGAGIMPSRIEGAESRSWVLIDCGAVVVHIFYPEAREYYALERLWADAEPVPLNLEGITLPKLS